MSEEIYEALKNGACRSAVGADLHNKDFSNLDLRKVNFSEANLEGADFQGANLNGASFQGADLSYACMAETMLKGANLSEADLCATDFCSADLRYANLEDAKMDHANICGADMRGAHLNGVNLHNVVHMPEAIWEDEPAQVYNTYHPERDEDNLCLRCGIYEPDCICEDGFMCRHCDMSREKPGEDHIVECECGQMHPRCMIDHENGNCPR